MTLEEMRRNLYEVIYYAEALCILADHNNDVSCKLLADKCKEIMRHILIETTEWEDVVKRAGGDK